DPVPTAKSITDLERFFSGVIQMRADAAEIENTKVNEYAKRNSPAATQKYQEQYKWLDELTDQEMSALKADVPLQLYDDEVISLIKASKSDIERLHTVTGDQMQSALDKGVKEEHRLDTADDIKTELETALSVEDRTLIQVGKKAVDAYLTANMVYDEEQTNADREAAANAVAPVVLKAGQNIILKGEAVTQEQYDLMKSLGLLTKGGLDIWLYVEVCLFVIGLSIPVAIYTAIYHKETVMQIPRLLLMLLVMLIVVAAAVPLSRYQPRLIPVFLATLLISAVYSERLAIVITVYLSLVVSIMAGYGEFKELQSVFNAVALIAAGWAGIFAIRKMQHRVRMVVGGVVSGGVYALLNVVLGLITGKTWGELLVWAEWSAASGVAAAIICLGTLPIWETLFRIATPTKLLELGNTNQPLLKRLMIEAPGTYHHSIMTANLAEAAAEAIGANALLCRVGAFYHDIGKLKNPQLYIENQLGYGNPHDELSPTASADIIKEHVAYGEQLAQSCRIPKPIQDMISQHHGTAPILFFYHKAASEPGSNVDLERFRYEGPKPQTKEAALLMLSDGIEAALHAKQDKTEGSISSAVADLVKERIYDGQLDESPLTMNEIKTAQNVFIKVLSGAYHNRVEYPERAIASREKAE
ncbi:MAG: HDIG domain-containing protein, partial [Bacillota bacterium]|nr:HDIG domain-containing protein [Bacillota bacterium]